MEFVSAAFCNRNRSMPTNKKQEPKLFWDSYRRGTYVNPTKPDIKVRVKRAGGNWKAVRKELKRIYFRNVKLVEAAVKEVYSDGL